MLVVPLRFTKMKFCGEVKSRLGHFYNTKFAQHVGWLNYKFGETTWTPANLW